MKHDFTKGECGPTHSKALNLLKMKRGVKHHSCFTVKEIKGHSYCKYKVKKEADYNIIFQPTKKKKKSAMSILYFFYFKTFIV